MPPEQLKPFFRDANAETFDPEAYPAYTIGRILELANEDAVISVYDSHARAVGGIEVTAITVSGRGEPTAPRAEKAVLFRLPAATEIRCTRVNPRAIGIYNGPAHGRGFGRSLRIKMLGRDRFFPLGAPTAAPCLRGNLRLAPGTSGRTPWTEGLQD